MVVTWRWLAALAIASPQVAQAATAAAPLVHVHTAGTDLKLSGGAAAKNRPGIKGEANLTLDVAGIVTSIKGMALAGSDDTSQSGDTWNRSTLSIDTHWQSDIAKWDLRATQNVQSSLREEATPGTLASRDIEQQTMERRGRATVSVQPLRALDLTLGADSRDIATTQGQWLVSAPRQTHSVETSSQRAFAKAQWSPLADVSVDGQVALTAASMTLDGPVAGQTTYRTMDTHLSLQMKPWSGGRLTLSAAKTATPLDANDFAAYIAAMHHVSDMALRPDSVRAVSVGLSQAFGPISFKIVYRTATLDSTTVLLPAASGQMPASISGGRAESLTTSLNLSLAALSLPQTHITSKAVWRRSRIADPLTGRAHGLSGEVPHEAQWRLTHDMPQDHLVWGLIGTLGAETHYYQAAALDTITTGDSIGAFVQYAPGPFALRFHVDGLAGGLNRSDIFYVGNRASGRIDHIVHSESAAPIIGLSLTTALDG